MGITPACAGKRQCRTSSCVISGDHPRMCGEKGWPCAMPAAAPGSPPHVRGKVQSWITATWIRRITPACAGKSPLRCPERIFQLGSPPHVRGKVQEFNSSLVEVGITPACAGKRLKRSRSTVPHAAIVPLFPSVCNKPAGSDGSPAGHDAPPFLPIENAAPASPAYNLRSL